MRPDLPIHKQRAWQPVSAVIWLAPGTTIYDPACHALACCVSATRPPRPHARRPTSTVCRTCRPSAPHSYLRVAMLFPELRRLLVPLAHTLPDKRFAILMQVRCAGVVGTFHVCRHSSCACPFSVGIGFLLSTPKVRVVLNARDVPYARTLYRTCVAHYRRATGCQARCSS